MKFSSARQYQTLDKGKGLVFLILALMICRARLTVFSGRRKISFSNKLVMLFSPTCMKKLEIRTNGKKRWENSDRISGRVYETHLKANGNQYSLAAVELVNSTGHQRILKDSSVYAVGQTDDLRRMQ